MKKLTKRTLAVVLSMLMVLTSAPISALAVLSTSATPSDDQIAKNLMTAITTFESKFDGTIYFDMGDAYNDYTAAVKAYDQYCYGDVDVDMQSHIDKLNEWTDGDGTDDLRVWLGMDGTYNGYSGNYLTAKNLNKIYNADDASANIGNYYTNLLWSQTGSNASTAKASVAGGNFKGPLTGNTIDRNYSIDMYYPQVVLMYDGVTTPRSTITMVYQGGSANKSRYIFCAYGYVGNQTGSNQFRLAQWYGANDNAVNANRNLDNQGLTFSNSSIEDDATPLALRYSVKTGTFSTTWYTNNYSFSAVWQYGINMTSDLAYDTLKPKVFVKGQSEEGWNSAGDDLDVAVEGNTDVYILNYKRLIDAAKDRRGQTAMNTQSQRYRYGGAAELFAAYDTLTAFDPNTYFTNGNRITECAAGITSEINALNAAAVPTKDNDSSFTGYQTLRDAIAGTNGRRKDYQDAIASELAGIDETTWDGFAGTNGVYTNALNIFKNASGLYSNGAAAQTAGVALRDYVLYPNRVDTTNLETLINEAYIAIANKSYFTNASFTSAALQTTINHAKSAVWGSVAHFGMEKYKLIDSASAQATVATEAQALSTALMTLQIDTTAVSLAQNASLDDMLDDASYIDITKYSNGSSLSEIIGQANTYKQRNLSIAVVQEGCVEAKIDEYLDLIKSIKDIIDNLRLAFSEINDGDMASAGTVENTYADHPAADRDIGLVFTRNINQIIFRKTHTSLEKSLGNAKFQFRNKEVRDAYLDCLSINDTYNHNAEIYAKGGLNTENPSKTLTDSDVANINSGVNFSTNLTASGYSNAVISVDNIVMTKAGGDPIATRALRDGDNNITEVVNVGTDATDADKDFTNDFRQIEKSGVYPLIGAHAAKNSTASFSTAFKVTLPATTAATTLTENTKPKLITYTASPYLGAAYSWGCVAANISSGISGGLYDMGIEWRGYAHARVQYTQTIHVVDVAYLFDLWNMCAEAASSSQGYTAASYAAFKSAYDASKVNFNYGSMTAAAITTECQNRYTSLWNAYHGLVRCASNQVLYDAQSATINDYRLGNASAPDKTYSDATWNAFVSAYNAVNSALSGTYSDANVREMDVNDQQATNEMNALANALLNAKANLAPVVKLAPLYIATENIINYIDSSISEDDLSTPNVDESKHYTAESLQAVADALKSNTTYPLLQTYTNGTTEVPYTAAQYNERETEINSIYKVNKNVVTSDLLALLVESSIDDSAFEYAVQLAEAQVNPDSYAQYQQIMQRLETMTTTTEVEMFKSFTVGSTTMQALSLTGVNYDTQAEADEAPAEILEVLNEPVKYTVTVDGVTFTDAQHADGKFAYGEVVTVSKDSKVDWYYTFTSQTSSNNIEKYLGASESQTITVTGNAIFRTGAPQTDTNCRVDYIRSTATDRNYASSFVTKGTKITLAQPLKVAFYNFTGYTIDGDEYAPGDQYTVTDSVRIIANYEAAEDEGEYTITIYNISKTKNVANHALNITFEAFYNDRVDVTRFGLTGGYKLPGETKNKQVTVDVNGETKTFGNTKYIHKDTSPIYAWAVVPASKAEDWETGLEDEFQADLAKNAEYIVMYGEDYSFNVVEDTYLIPLTEAWYEEELDEELINVASLDENVASVNTHDALIDNGTKFSMIGQFVLPEGARFIETGMLFTSGTNVAELDTDMSLAKAGTNGIYRLKSSKHTAGNQFVISMRKDGFVQGETVVYQGYLVYELNGKQCVQYSPAPVTALAIV
ncbi:MAG: hypothetical protein IJT65_07640 [Eubacterium sp.]|nr:hypothetical protein [Eubacterium sp.]